MSERKQVLVIGGILCVLFCSLGAASGRQKKHAYRYSDVDMPVSLAVGTVRTPQFSVVAQWYDIMIQVEKPLPFSQMRCMMGVTASPLDLKECSKNDPLLRANWTVWDGDRMVNQGADLDRCACKFEDKYIFRFLGSFAAESGKKYVVEVKFTKDGTPLNVANPHLIVIQHRHN